MVRVTAFHVRERKDDGSTFVALELTGGLEMVQSAATGKFYATVRKCSVPSTLDEATAKLMVGSTMEGEIVRVESDAYEFVNKRTGEVLTLSHSYAYRPAGAMELVGHTQVSEFQAA